MCRFHAPRQSGRAVSLLALLGCVAFVAVCGCKKEAAPPPAPPEVEVVAVVQTNVPIYQDWVGTLEGDVNATISAQVSGYLLNRNYTEGAAVTNGQVLFQIDPAPFKAVLDQAESQLAQAQATETKYAMNVEKYQPLVLKQAISQQELDDAVQNQKAAQANVQAARAAVEQAKLNLGFTTIHAPVKGIAGLASAQAQVGNLVGPGSGPLTTVTTVDPIRAYVSIAQAFMTKAMEKSLAEGRNLRSTDIKDGGAELELILADGQVYSEKGRVRFADNQVDVRTGTIRVVGEFPNPQSLLVPGMFVRVRALLETLKGALVVPQRAVTDMQGRALIAVVGANNKVSIRPVQTVSQVGSDWVVQGDLKAGDRVIAEGIQKVREGVVVKPVPFAEKVAAAAPTPVKAEEKQ
jgi:RND family efflux transporter MFP subunit